VNSMIATVTGGFQGISFAIPIDLAMDVVGQLQAGGSVKRGMLGVSIGPVTRDLADAFGLQRAQGALISGVTKDSAADKAGIKEGDVITQFNGRTIEDSRDLPRYVTAVRPGTPAKVQVWRDNKSVELSVTLDEFKEAIAISAPNDRSTPRGSAPPKPEVTKEERLGLSLRPLTEKERTAAKMTSGGAVVASVDDKSNARSLAEGDIIVSVTRSGARTNVESPAQLAGLIKAAEKGKNIAFRVKRATDRAGTDYQEFFAPEKMPE
jgi:serine protease Do